MSEPNPDMTCAVCGHERREHADEWKESWCMAWVDRNPAVYGADAYDGAGNVRSDACECDAFDSIANAAERQWEHNQRALANG